MDFRWGLCIVLWSACGDDAPAPRTPAPQTPAPEADGGDVALDAALPRDVGRDAARDATGPHVDATIDAGACRNGRVADGGCLPSCDDLPCEEGFVCRFGSCHGADCVRLPQCQEVVSDCSECKPTQQCWSSLCIDDASGCETTCEDVIAN